MQSSRMEEALSTKGWQHDSHPSSHYMYDIPHRVQEGGDRRGAWDGSTITDPVGAGIIVSANPQPAWHAWHHASFGRRQQSVARRGCAICRFRAGIPADAQHTRRRPSRMSPDRQNGRPGRGAGRSCSSLHDMQVTKPRLRAWQLSI